MTPGMVTSFAHRFPQELYDYVGDFLSHSDFWALEQSVGKDTCTRCNHLICLTELPGVDPDDYKTEFTRWFGFFAIYRGDGTISAWENRTGIRLTFVEAAYDQDAGHVLENMGTIDHCTLTVTNLELYFHNFPDRSTEFVDAHDDLLAAINQSLD